MQALKSNLDRIRAAASGRWEFVVSTIAKVPSSMLDGKHHACPSGKCSSKKDAFRAFDDFSKSGGTVCNQCGKHADGFATLQWLTGRSFKEVVNVVGSLLGVDSTPNGQPVDPAYHLKWIDWNDSLAATWCLAYKPVIPEAIKLAGGRMAIYRGKHTVIALPVWIANKSNIVGWRVWNVRGKLPKFGKTKDDPIEWVKSKLTYGSQPGVVGTMAAKATEVWKVEGETDMLALLSINPRASVICNASGAGENPTKFHWLKEPFQKAGSIYVLHDADNPGQEGAERWTKYLAAMLGPKCQVANVELPYPIQATKGKDLRDWIGEGNRYETLMERTKKYAVVHAVSSLPEEATDDPHRLARINLEYYEREKGGLVKYWRYEWWKYKSGCWKKIEDDDFRSKLNASIRREFERDWRLRQEKGGEEANQPIRKVTESLVSNVLGATKSIDPITYNLEMPIWLPDRSRRNYLSMRNGLLDLDAIFAGKPLEECLLSHSPHWFSPFQLTYDFDPEAECPNFQQYLDFICDGDQEKYNLLQEWAGYLLWPHALEQKFFVFEGDGGTGKSTFFSAMTAMLGDENVSSLSLEDFGGAFNLQSVIGKAANISGDVGQIQGPEETILKRFTGVDKMTMQRKHKSEVSVRPTAKLMMAWNERPKFRDKTEGLWRRMILIPLNRRIPVSQKNKQMVDYRFWTKEASGIMNWALVGLARLLEQKGFSECKAANDALGDYRTDVNPVRAFFEEFVEEKPGCFVQTKFLYEKYKEWAENTGHKVLNDRSFGKQVILNTKATRGRTQEKPERFYIYHGINYTTTKADRDDQETISY